MGVFNAYDIGRVTKRYSKGCSFSAAAFSGSYVRSRVSVELGTSYGYDRDSASLQTVSWFLVKSSRQEN